MEDFNDELKKQAYLEASRLKNAGHDNEVIHARLEKQGFPEGLIEWVILNLSIQKVIDTDKKIRPFYNMALIKIGIGVLLAIVSAIIIPGQIYLPIGFIISGVIYAMLTKKYIL